MCPQKVVSIKFSETFLTDSREALSEDELRSIASLLAENPYCGSPSKEIEHLRSLPWPRSDEGSARWQVWYLTYPEIPHIEVVALTTSDDPASSDIEIRHAVWKVLRIGMFLRLLYKAYKLIRDNVEHLPDFPDLPSIGA
jgi:hypothetical protein